MNETEIKDKDFRKSLLMLLAHDSEVKSQIRNILSEKITFGEDTLD